jgi:parallel beta-helix repeat protein
MTMIAASMLQTVAAAQDLAPGIFSDSSRGPIIATEYLPAGFLTDGSASYQSALQRAIDDAIRTGRAIVFPPMTYRLDNPSGLQIGSGLTLSMYGAKFAISDDCRQDGQAFFGESVSDVHLFGGEIVGRNDRWADGINVRGIYLTGSCQRIRIRDMRIYDLSSNGIGIFGAGAERPAQDIWITDTIIQNCCNKYGDYTASAGELRGPEKGSTRQDQGLVALYFVNDFVVRGCRLEDSRSDGTHFFRCRAGQFVDNKVYRAKMGGYFIESCEGVLAANNTVVDNGSRGVTIERGSTNCTLLGNTVQGSGREGLWIPDCRKCVVMGNLFNRNGRKPNTSRQTWNANITIDEAATNDPSNQWTPGCQDYMIANNTIETDQSQVAAIRVNGTNRFRSIVIKDNLLTGDNRRILLEGESLPEVRITGNGEQP